MEIAEVIDSLLKERGINGEAREHFLNPDYNRDTHDPFLLSDMKKAAKRLLEAISKGERIAIYADFDCDGIPAAVIMSDFLKKVGHENFEIYIPHRHNEGHGFHKNAVDDLTSRGVTLIITVDVGIVAFKTAKHAHSIGVDVIITDHHELNEGKVPQAIAVINPKRGKYPFKELCGSAVAFKLVQATLAKGRESDIAAFTTIPIGWEKWLLDMVGIATIADMVPLIEENRVLARFGLKVLRKSPRLGIQALCRKLRLNQSMITEDDIGFSIAPRINAASRMDEPELAFRMLSTHSPKEAESLVGELEKLNSKRKGTVASLVKEAKRVAKERFPNTQVAVFGNPNWKPALLGLAANALVDERGGAVCLWGRDGNGAIKGSCRSDGSINIIEMFNEAHKKNAIEESGGHARAGGFSVSHDQVHNLQDIFARAAEKFSQSDSKVVAKYDAELDPMLITYAFQESLSKLSPFGIGNPKPLFRFPALLVEEVRIFGKNQSHTEIIVRNNDSSLLRAFDFFRTPDQFTEVPRVGSRVDLIATIERDTFRGNSLVLRLTDVVVGS